MIAVVSRGLSHNRDYILYRVARVASILGSQISGIAYPLLVLRLGGSAAEAGAVFTCGMAVRLICQMPGGHIADRVDRRLLMIVADLVRLLAASAIPLVSALDHGHVAYAQLLATAVVEGAATSVFGPSATAYIRDLVPAEDLPRALGQTQGFSAATNMIGPALGGLLFGLSVMLPFVVDAVSYAVSAVLLLVVRTAATPPPAGADRRFTAGLRWLRGQPEMVRLLAFAGFLNLASAAIPVTVIVSQHGRGASSDTIGAILTCIGIGSIAGSMLARHVMARLNQTRLSLALGLAWTAGLASFALESSPWALGPVLALMCVLSPASGILLGTMTLKSAPPDLLGRISTAQMMVSLSLAALGPVLAGVLLQGLGVSTTWLILAGSCLVATVIGIAPALRRGSVKPSVDVPSGDAGAPLPQR